MDDTRHIGTYKGLAGKRVLVTGAGRGMGKTIALGFLRNDARVLVADSDDGRLQAFKAEEPLVQTCQVDVTDPAQVDRLFGAVRDSLGGLDIVMNNTGVSGPVGPVEGVDIDAWNRMMAINVSGAFHVVRRAVPLLKAAGGGSIMINSSTAGLMGYPYRVAYAASKFALVGMARSLAMELGGHGIRVNTICPGPVYADRQDEGVVARARAAGVPVAQARERYFESFAMSLSLPDSIEPEDIANMVLFVCSDAGRKITGQSLAVDGDTQTLIEPPPAALLLQADPRAALPQTTGGYLERARARFVARFGD